MSKVKTNRGDNVVDICISSYGHLEGLISLCRDNGLSLDHDEVAASSRDINEEIKAELRISRPLFPVTASVAKEQVTVQRGQNIVDLALQETGSIEGLISLLRENNLTAEVEAVSPGTVVKVRTSDVLNESIRSFYRELNHRVNTSEAAGEEIPVANGIGQMIIETNFIVG